MHYSTAFTVNKKDQSHQELFDTNLRRELSILDYMLASECTYNE